METAQPTRVLPAQTTCVKCPVASLNPARPKRWSASGGLLHPATTLVHEFRQAVIDLPSHDRNFRKVIRAS